MQLKKKVHLNHIYNINNFKLLSDGLTPESHRDGHNSIIASSASSTVGPSYLPSRRRAQQSFHMYSHPRVSCVYQVVSKKLG